MTINEKKKKKFLVIGLGAIGAIFSSHLKTSGCSIYGIDVMQDWTRAIEENGISIEGLTSLHARLDQACTQLNDLKEENFDYIIISVKTPYMPEVVSMIKRKFNGDFKVVSMQNGIDNEEYLVKFFGKERTMRVAVNFAGNIISPGLIKMTFFHKPNYVGCLCGEKSCIHSKEFADLMTEAHLDTEATEDIKKYTWRKTILVAALAPISAILGITMAEVMATSETRYLVQTLLEEAIAVAKAKNHDLGEGFFEQSIEYLATAGHHKPSMLIDIEKGNPTEIEYINGKISFYGHELNIPVLSNTHLTLLIKAKEQFQINKNK